MLALFDPVIDEITKLVEQQVEEAKKNSASAIDVTSFNLLVWNCSSMLTLTSSVLFSWVDLASHPTCTKLLENGVDETEELL